MKDDISLADMEKLKAKLKEPCPPGGNFDKLCGVLLLGAEVVLDMCIAEKKAIATIKGQNA